ncbi:hypothetical protein IRT45_35195 [Nocardia sp. BSTN01]|uniref:hypothetical protein n=1 Tax=Nocardia sp. BSTN01 TaxID=2783665 RepID=UPI00188DD8B0|nr:hypothetical protein [Nocardia sp. BSTN01]MBF5002365.1 hypothetical protein [Nocardia sp. BSTN01]
MPDRYGDEPLDDHKCWGGWATPPDSDTPRRCPVCRPDPIPSATDEPTNLSDRARAAIEKADGDE